MVDPPGAPSYATGMDVSTRAWYVAVLKPGRRAQAERNLVRQGAQVFMPERIETVQRGGRQSERRVALFPGYLFVAPREGDGWAPLGATLGVSRLITRTTGAAQPVPGAFIEELAARCDDSGLALPCGQLEVGDAVEITRGPFHGLAARVTGMGSDERVAVLLEVMGRAVRMDLARGAVERQSSA